MSNHKPTIVTGAELGRILDLSERSIREHRGKERVFRAGNGYDFKRSLTGMLDYQRVEAAKKGAGDPGQTLWETYRDVLRYRTGLSDELRELRATIEAILALPALPEDVRALTAHLPPYRNGERVHEDEDGDG